jgi:glycosyltransferase involved in cell wall biosynthesis
VKILSIAIPCYNSAAYMRRCIDSLLSGGEDVEILIVDDGSTKDNTASLFCASHLPCRRQNC